MCVRAHPSVRPSNIQLTDCYFWPVVRTSRKTEATNDHYAISCNAICTELLHNIITDNMQEIYCRQYRSRLSGLDRGSTAHILYKLYLSLHNNIRKLKQNLYANIIAPSLSLFLWKRDSFLVKFHFDQRHTNRDHLRVVINTFVKTFIAMQGRCWTAASILRAHQLDNCGTPVRLCSSGSSAVSPKRF